MDLWDQKNKPKIDWDAAGFGAELEMAVRRECHSCFRLFDTTSRWAKRCPECKAIDAPKRKKIINHDVDPF